MVNIFSIWRKARILAAENKLKEIDAKERQAIAKAFNDRYTFFHRYVNVIERLPGTAMGGLTPRGGNAWMCPDCNKIHLAIECSVFTGLQYPQCCQTPAGHRLYYKIKGGCE